MTDETVDGEGPRRRGRPPYQPSPAARKTVREMKFAGSNESMIARALKIDVDTMRKHFAEELAEGHAIHMKEVVGLLFKAARKGNVAAIKKLEEMGRAAGAAEAVNRRSSTPPKLGKKEEQQAAAERVGGKFTPPSPPKLIVSNG